MQTRSQESKLFKKQDNETFQKSPYLQNFIQTPLLTIQPSSFVVKQINDFDQDYEVVGELGEGSFGQVLKIRHRKLRILRALKKICKKGKNPEFSTFQEIQVLKKLDHYNILKIFQFYETDQFYFIITELFEGKELFEEILQVDKFTQETTCRIIREILVTLLYTHSQGIVHRDIKPENILIKNLDDCEKMKIKIIDWGLSTLADGKKSNRVCGTPEYAAPEVFKGFYSCKCDMWSLGVLTFVLMIGSLPFPGQNHQQIIRLVKKGKIKLQKTFLQLSNEAKDFIRKLIEKNPEQRMSAYDALNHPWIQNFEKPKEIPLYLQITLERLKEFSMKNQLSVAIVDIINNHYCSQIQKDKLDEVFRFLDLNGDGVISVEELIEGYSQIYGRAIGSKIAEQIFMKLDLNHNGTLQYSQFVTFGLRRMKGKQKQRLRQVFQNFDRDGDGLLCYQQFEQIFSGKVKNLSENTIRNLRSDFNNRKVEYVNFEEFYQFISAQLNKHTEC